MFERKAFYVSVPEGDALRWRKWINNYCSIVWSSKEEDTNSRLLVCIPKTVISKFCFNHDLNILKSMGIDMKYYTY